MKGMIGDKQRLLHILEAISEIESYTTNADFNVVCWAGAQVQNARDGTIELGGSNYVFWGGREGYMSLLNTNMKREQEHLEAR